MAETTRVASSISGVLLMTVLATACGGSGGGAAGAGTGTGGPTAAGAPAQHPHALVGEVGKNDAFAISLHDDQGRTITNLAAGTYQLTVHDDSRIHNFHLLGPGAGEATQVGSTGTQTFTVTFQPGTYTFQCDPHASSMHGSLHVS